ncbi:MAG: glycosyltransferase family 1 protein [Sphingobacteriales bacterium]|nr:MAG: glycosyltransferase family 1 protein [Sphingobacteriales bacterium]
MISDTAVCRQGNETLAFEPVVRELSALKGNFSEIIWLGCKVHEDATALKAVDSKKIRVIVMPSVSHKSLNALRVLLAYPAFVFYILRYLPSATHVHTRAPSHPALLGILLSFLDRKRIYWHKYAGDWVSPDAPYTYRLQRQWLNALRFKNIRVTVNGSWKNAPAHVFAFENPCITEAERKYASLAASSKDFSSSLSLLFVGNINANKGITNLLTAIREHRLDSRFTDLYIVGSGPLLGEVKRNVIEIDSIRIHIAGHISRQLIDQYYKKCHLLMLPSQSEGFPKVIAEAAAYGCIPVVTDISAISQYITDGSNGFLLRDNRPDTIAQKLSSIALNKELSAVSKNAILFTEKFTYEHFTERIQTEIYTQ